MSSRSILILCLVALPIIAVAAGWPLWLTVLVLALILLARQAATMAALGRRREGPALELETIGASHFAEKVRWCMDRLALDYSERQWVGTLGAFYRGRSVPTLHVYGRGFGHWQIGNSADILRYLWGCHGVGRDDAEFLRPTPKRVELEARLDAYGRELQRWVYFHLLPHRSTTLRAWGAEDRKLPLWQRLLIRVLYPIHKALVARAFAVSQGGYEKSCERIEGLLADMESRLGEAPSITGEVAPNYCDITLAALSGLWLLPAAYGGGAAEGVRIPEDEQPEGMRRDRTRWRQQFPQTIAHIERLYAERTTHQTAQGIGSPARG